jgi:hypothetical protein
MSSIDSSVLQTQHNQGPRFLQPFKPFLSINVICVQTRALMQTTLSKQSINTAATLTPCHLPARIHQTRTGGNGKWPHHTCCRSGHQDNASGRCWGTEAWKRGDPPSSSGLSLYDGSSDWRCCGRRVTLPRKIKGSSPCLVTLRLVRGACRHTSWANSGQGCLAQGACACRHSPLINVIGRGGVCQWIFFCLCRRVCRDFKYIGWGNPRRWGQNVYLQGGGCTFFGRVCVYVHVWYV